MSVPSTRSRPLLIAVPLAVPPEKIVIPPEAVLGSLPVLMTETLTAEPPDETNSLPEPDMVEPEAVPLENTAMSTPSPGLSLPV